MCKLIIGVHWAMWVSVSVYYLPSFRCTSQQNMPNIWQQHSKNWSGLMFEPNVSQMFEHRFKLKMCYILNICQMFTKYFIWIQILIDVGTSMGQTFGKHFGSVHILLCSTKNIINMSHLKPSASAFNLMISFIPWTLAWWKQNVTLKRHEI